MLQAIDQALTLAINGSHSLYLDHVAVITSQTTTWIPAALVLAYVLLRHNDLVAFIETLLAIALCILLADQVASSVCKPLFARYRPTHDPFIMYAVDVVNGYRGGLYGFISSHAANTFAVSAFIALLIKHKPLTLWSYSWALANCWSRAYLGVHYVGDLMVGALWGTLVGWAIYKFWKRFSHHSTIWLKYNTHHMPHAPEEEHPSPTLTPSGYTIKAADMLIATFALTYLYIAFRALW